MTRLFICAGEPSGDQRAAELVKELRGLIPLECKGFGGAQMAGAGVELVADLESYAVMGFSEVLTALPRLMGLAGLLRRCIAQHDPAALVLVDYPGMNLRLARWAHRRGMTVVYYVSPQLWAWGGYRAGAVVRNVDLMMTLFRFETDFYRERGMKNAVWVGHPLLDSVRSARDRGAAEPMDETVTLAMLPGSRSSEVARLLPRMLEAFHILREEGIVSRARVAACSSVEDAAYRRIASGSGVEVVSCVGEALSGAAAALVCSGTATLETALHGVPFVVAYRTSWLTYLIARLLVRGVDRIALANLVAGGDVVPELVQGRATGPAMARFLRPLLKHDSAVRSRMVEQLRSRVATGLGPPGAAARAARQVARLLGAEDLPDG